MKKWKREYKENVIQEMNPEWKDLYDNFEVNTICGDSCMRRNDSDTQGMTARSIISGVKSV